MVQRPLVDISGKILDLGISEKFLEIYDEVGFDKVILTPYSPNQGVYAEKS